MINLIISVGDLRHNGSISKEQIKLLNSDLKYALKALDKSRPDLAKNKVEAFIGKVQDFKKTSVLTEAEGEPLIAAANEIIDALGGGLYKSGEMTESTESPAPDEYVLEQKSERD